MRVDVCFLANLCLPEIKLMSLGVEESDLLLSIIFLIQHNKLFRYCFILWAFSNIFQRISSASHVTVLTLAPVFRVK